MLANIVVDLFVTLCVTTDPGRLHNHFNVRVNPFVCFMLANIVVDLFVTLRVATDLRGFQVFRTIL
jgi:hypothetical protein